MIRLEYGAYTEKQVRRALHARGGVREVFYTYDLLGAMNIKKGELKVESGSITMDNSRDIKRTGRFVIKDEGNINWQADKIQPWFNLRMPDGGIVRYPLGVFYMPTCPRSGRPGAYYRDVEAYDITLNLQEDAVTERYYIKAGAVYTEEVEAVLATMGIYNAIIEPSSERLGNAREWEIGTSKMEIINELLTAINYGGVMADPWGHIIANPYVQPFQRLPDYTYKKDEYSIIGPDETLVQDAFYLPNVYVGIVSNPEIAPLTYQYEIRNPENPLSAENRDGRHVVKTMIYNEVASMSALIKAVEKEAAESSQVYETNTFETLNMPHHGAGDILLMQSDGASGKYQETAWEMELKAGATMKHTIRKVVPL